MIFSSPEFVFAFLPITFLVYFLLNRFKFIYFGKLWLVVASLYFYSYWSLNYLPLMLGSIIISYSLGMQLAKGAKRKKEMLTVGIVANLAVLCYYKYMNFFLDNINIITEQQFHIEGIILPIGISFYTFTQIAFLVDSYKGSAKEYDLVNYALFVTFFPHLIAGPILHHKEMMSQFKSLRTVPIKYNNILMGLMIFGIGLFKKTIIADTFAQWAEIGYVAGTHHDFYSAWVTSLSYTFQLYFDFSGYCDMAIGAALLFNIWLPINFNSPYKAINIQDFWRRWHITLGRYLRDYLYIPLGGNRCTVSKTYCNLFLTFVIGGLWHGASWMFIIWGAMHGLALVIHRVWSKFGIAMYKPLAWMITFLYVHIAWVFFRAHTVQDAMNIITAMFNIDSARAISVSAIPITNMTLLGVNADVLLAALPVGLVGYSMQIAAIACAFCIVSSKNALEIVRTQEQSIIKVGVLSLLTVTALYMVLHTTSPVFLYFNF
ncbi:MBOAT, membrane-bound O-acyltransferase family protein [Enterobacter cloacae S611]|uniref:Probable alginate O-acetylase n=1 Tax=Enterobacter cloacae S611 TaxID=1399146 RepID=A0ABN0QBE0_ENTCL|nr:MBOAT, membrane-bound O-acyltransferase family protein [Enterobacter cloacae S611]